MSDEPATSSTPRRTFHFWPRTVRWRLTLVSALVFAIAFSAAAFGLVRVVHNNLVDRIGETNQQQLDALQASIDNGALDVPGATTATCTVTAGDACAPVAVTVTVALAAPDGGSPLDRMPIEKLPLPVPEPLAIWIHG